MEKLTEKESICLKEYLKDLLEMMDSNKETEIRDNVCIYTREELKLLYIKISS